jgi:murein DD-endopeptidase MepM/ murein hydrolase activator NlpD
VSKKFTILLIPEGTHNVRRFKVHGLLLPLALTVLFATLALSGYWYFQYQSIKTALPDVQALQQQTQRQEAQLSAFSQRLATVKDQMVKLRAFNQRLKAMANLDKPGGPEPILGVGGPEVASAGRGVKLSTTVRERQINTMQRELEQVAAEGESERLIQEELAKFLNERRSILAATPSIWPAHGWVTSGFGYRVSPWTGERQFHAGLDVSTRVGSPVVAPAEGVVTFLGPEGAYGKFLVINHGHGLVTRYGHLNDYKVTVGQRVKRGQAIATVGNSGRSTGPHLHYEVLLSGVPVNPRYYILD